MTTRVQEFELHGDTLATARLKMHPITMHFTAPAAERDFLRFRTAGRAAIVIATLAANTVIYVFFVAVTPSPTVAVAVAANLVGLLAEIAFVACSRPTSIERQAARATRHERISAVANAVSNLAIAARAAHVFQLRCGAEPTRAAYRECMTQFDSSNLLAITTVLVAPRLTIVIPILVSTTVVYVVNVNVQSAYVDPIDYLSDAVVMVGYTVALSAAAWVKERRERSFFRTILALQRANAEIGRQREATHAVLAAVLPAPLLQMSAQGVSHHSMHATVAVTDIYSFSAWSTWHLEVDVIHILHAVMAAYDKVVDQHDGIERAMTYGDSYVVCSGLLEPHHGHADAVKQCAIELRTASSKLSRRIDAQVNTFNTFNTRTSIFTASCAGPASGRRRGGTPSRGPPSTRQSMRLGCASSTKSSSVRILKWRQTPRAIAWRPTRRLGF
jgi:hypothetical protein